MATGDDCDVIDAARDGYASTALEALGGAKTEFYLTGQDKADSGAFECATVILSCRYQGCDWGLFVGEMELWEFVTDARAHWEDKHATTEGDAAPSLPTRPTRRPRETGPTSEASTQ